MRCLHARRAEFCLGGGDEMRVPPPATGEKAQGRRGRQAFPWSAYGRAILLSPPCPPPPKSVLGFAFPGYGAIRNLRKSCERTGEVETLWGLRDAWDTQDRDDPRGQLGLVCVLTTANLHPWLRIATVASFALLRTYAPARLMHRPDEPNWENPRLSRAVWGAMACVVFVAHGLVLLVGNHGASRSNSGSTPTRTLLMSRISSKMPREARRVLQRWGRSAYRPNVTAEPLRHKVPW